MRKYLIAGLLAASGCGLTSMTIDEPSLCKTVQGITVPGAPVSGSVSVPVQVDLREALQKIEVKSGHATIIAITVKAADDTDLGTIKTGGVTLHKNGGEVPVVTYSPASTIELKGSGVDVFEEARAAPLDLVVSLSGALPAEAWHADVSVCLALRATVDATAL